MDFSCILAFTTGYEEGGVPFPRKRKGNAKKEMELWAEYKLTFDV